MLLASIPFITGFKQYFRMAKAILKINKRHAFRSSTVVAATDHFVFVFFFRLQFCRRSNFPCCFTQAKYAVCIRNAPTDTSYHLVSGAQKTLNHRRIVRGLPEEPEANQQLDCHFCYNIFSARSGIILYADGMIYWRAKIGVGNGCKRGKNADGNVLNPHLKGDFCICEMDRKSEKVRHLLCGDESKNDIEPQRHA